MPQLPQHKASAFLDLGMSLRRIPSPLSSGKPIGYAHQDDYYIFGIVEDGTACGLIDFKEYHFSKEDVFLIQPGQVHRFVSSDDAKGIFLIAESSFVGDAEKHVFDKFSLSASSFKIDEERKQELEQIASILIARIECSTGESTKMIVRKLTETFIAIIAEALQSINLHQTTHSRRHIEIVLSFRDLLADRLAENRRPSYYASLLNISPVYLNEVVREVTGMSVSLYIKNEVVLQAKRLLIHTDFAVKEISNRLGIDDYAYFSRLFTGVAGINPTAFRQRNLK